MTPPERLTVRGPEDILGFIPHSLGYWPANSLVAMTLQGKRLGATLRLDLPGPGALADAGAFAGTVCGYLEADEHADGTLLALFSNNGWLSGPGCHGGLLSGLQAALCGAGMPVKEAWYVGDRYWRHAWCAYPSCCPVPGRPVQQIRDSLLSTEMVYRGSSVGPPPEARPAPVPVPAAHRAAVLEAEAVWWAQLELRRSSRPQFEAVLRQWEAMLARPAHLVQPSVHREAFLRATLLVPAWRDALLVMAAAGKSAASAGAEEFGTFGGDAGLRPLEPAADDAQQGSVPAGADTTGAPSHAMQAVDMQAVDIKGIGMSDVPGGSLLMSAGGQGTPGYGDVLMGNGPAVPQWQTMEALDAVLGQLALLGGAPAAAALTGRGWIAWSRGRGSYAAAYLSEALEVEPGYRLAELLLEMVRRGAVCGWASRKEAAWQKFRPDVA
ncbi:conserved hypothetical protein [Arthrobacter sp. 9AX]|uniref:DUF4192 domain-containing protein n=1 Tax=Arthrobacter sp. 9AX TaxID=2653131 RepID=UPI0012EFC610|nr:DUF4192 domain-containing protein [Arthrobacter sp. 9AX]VXB14152.1 conserved hypothetical protein [Arthrobacter sp. 9AX]